MTFMVVDTNSYDVLLGLDLLIKIGTIVDVEQGLIQVRHGPRSDVEVLPLTMMNMLQKLNSKTLIQADAAILETHMEIWIQLSDDHLCMSISQLNDWMHWCRIQT